MKKLLHITFFCLLTFLSRFTFAQFNPEQDTKNKWGCAVAINSVEAQLGDPENTSWGLFQQSGIRDKTEKSFSLSIIPKCFISDDLLLRFELGITNINYTYNADYKDVDHSITNQAVEQKIYRYIPGIQWNFLKKKNIEIYCGISVYYIHYNTMNYAYYSEIRQLPTDTLVHWAGTNGSQPGGFATGIGAIAGFNFYLQKHISVGAEFSSALLYYQLGGQYYTTTTYQTIPNPPATYPVTIYSGSYNGFQFSKIMSSFNISFWF